MRNYKSVLPFILFLIAVLVGGLGAGNFAVVAFMAPLSIMICHEAGINILAAAASKSMRPFIGGNFMTSNLGIVFRQLAEEATTGTPLEGYASFSGQFLHFIVSFLFFSILVLCIVLFWSKILYVQETCVTMECPEKFNTKQKLTLKLLILMLAIVLIIPIFHMLTPSNGAITYLNKKQMLPRPVLLLIASCLTWHLKKK